MTKQKLHILVIDDDINTRVNFGSVRKNLPNAEIMLVKSSSSAIAKLEEWHRQGIRADIVASDISLDTSEDVFGGEALRKIDSWLISADMADGSPVFFIQGKASGAYDSGSVDRYAESYNDQVQLLSHLSKSGAARQRLCAPVDSYEWDDIADGLLAENGQSCTSSLRSKIAELGSQMETVPNPEPPNPTQQKLHILLVDDDINTEVDFSAVRRNLPNAEIALAHNVDEAIGTLKNWRDQGVTADIVDSDLGFMDSPEYGYQVLQKVDHWIQSTGNTAERPYFFLHSKDLGDIDSDNQLMFEELSGRNCKMISANEWGDIADGQAEGITSETHSTDLRKRIIELCSQIEAVSNPEPPNPTQHKLHILLVDDDINTEVDFTRVSTNLNGAEIVLTKNARHTITQLDKWRTDGIVPDIVVADVNFFGNAFEDSFGYQILDRVEEWFQSNGSDVDAVKFFIQSKEYGSIRDESLYQSTNSGKECTPISSYEWHDIQNGELTDFTPARDHSSALREHIAALASRNAPVATIGEAIIIEPVVPYRILIIDDDILAYVNLRELFENTSAHVEVVMASSGHHAWQMIEMYASEGKGFDAIDADYFLDARISFTSSTGQRIGRGLASLKFVTESCESLPESLRPKQFLLHSKDTDKAEAAMADYASELIGQTLIYDSSEWYDIMNHGNNYEISHGLEGRTTILREYFNRTIGTNFPLNDIEFRLFKEPDGKLEAYDVITAIRTGVFPLKEGLLKLKLRADLPNWLSPNIDAEFARENQIAETSFEEAEGQDTSGKAAFTEAHIHQLREQNDTPILFLNSFEPAQTSVLNKVGGVVLLDEAFGHLKPVAANHGIKAVMGKRDRVFIEPNDAGGLSYAYKNHDGTQTYARLNFGDDVTLGGHSVYFGVVPYQDLGTPDAYRTVATWQENALEGQSRLTVKANADTPQQVRTAIEFGANGIGLLRTEHMFFEDGRLKILQTALLTEDVVERSIAFVQLKDLQKSDFKEIFLAASAVDRPFPVTIRLLDAPPEEFMEADQVKAFTQKVGEKNTRGVQLAGRIPGLYAMQAEAILEAAKETDFKGQLDIMIPLVRVAEEFQLAKQEIAQVAERLNMQGRYKVRAMIETLDAVTNADEIAKDADGISFGTNDLTSESMGGVARNDIVATREWMARLDVNHIGKSPFLRLSDLVKRLMQETITKAREANPSIDIGICGHQVAGEQDSIEFCHKLGLDSISVPASETYMLASRLIAGQAAINYSRQLTPSPI